MPWVIKNGDPANYIMGVNIKKTPQRDILAWGGGKHGAIILKTKYGYGIHASDTAKLKEYCSMLPEYAKLPQGEFVSIGNEVSVRYVPQAEWIANGFGCKVPSLHSYTILAAAGGSESRSGENTVYLPFKANDAISCDFACTLRYGCSPSTLRPSVAHSEPQKRGGLFGFLRGNAGGPTGANWAVNYYTLELKLPNELEPADLRGVYYKLRDMNYPLSTELLKAGVFTVRSDTEPSLVANLPGITITKGAMTK